MLCEAANAMMELEAYLLTIIACANRCSWWTIKHQSTEEDLDILHKLTKRVKELKVDFTRRPSEG